MAKRKKGKGKAKATVAASPPLPPPQSSATVCAENISLLLLLGDVREPPTRNKPPASVNQEDGRTLSLSRERSLCGAFAFLASIDHNPNCVPAVCLQEEPKTQSLKIVVAMNKAKSTDCDDILARIKHGFEQLLLTLAKAGGDSSASPSTEDDVFDDVILMCAHRILCRLRLQGKRQGQSISTLLESAIIYHSLPVNLNSTSRRFIQMSRELAKLVHAWEQYQHHTSVKLLVEGIFRLSRIDGLENLISSIPNSLMNPECRKSLSNMIVKVARYREFSRHLYRSAKRFSILRRAEVVMVHLGEKLFQRPQDAGYEPDFSAAALRSRAMKTRGDLQHVCSLLSSKHKVPAKFQERTNKTLQESKVHAEVQLVYHYLLNPAEILPRVISSSKDACYLCNAFLSLEKTFYTPRCHGRLYPGWRLPFATGQEGLARRFNQELEDRIFRGYNSLVTPGGSKRHPCPNESTLLTLNWSNSTIPPRALTETPSPPQQSLEKTDLKPTGGLPGNAENKGGQEEMEKIAWKEEDSEDSEDACSGAGRGKEATSSRNTDTIKLESATTSLKAPQIKVSTPDISGRLEPGETSSLFSRGALGIQVESVTNRSSKNAPVRPLGFKITWLEESETAVLYENKSVQIVDALSVRGEVPCFMNEDGTIYISHLSHIARVQLI